MAFSNSSNSTSNSLAWAPRDLHCKVPRWQVGKNRTTRHVAPVLEAGVTSCWQREAARFQSVS